MGFRKILCIFLFLANSLLINKQYSKNKQICYANKKDDELEKIFDYQPEPDNDLFRITPASASMLSKAWLEILMIQHPLELQFSSDNKYSRRLDGPDYLYTSINKLESYLSTHRTGADAYFVWSPKPRGGTREALFIICTEIVEKDEKMIFNVNKLVQSPGWSPDLIDTAVLKKGLYEVYDKTNCTSINFENLRDSDIRYYMSWFIKTTEDEKVEEGNNDIGFKPFGDL